MIGCREKGYGTGLTLMLRQVYFVLCRGRGHVAVTARVSLKD